jgi:hypothetical protein
LFANVIGAAALDQLDGLISHADGYPGWARLLFLVSFVLVVASCVVYAVEYTRLKRRAEPAPESPTATLAP